VTNCDVEISGLFLFGHICFRSAQARIDHCNFRWVETGQESLLEVWDHSHLTIADCSFTGHREFGIILEKNTFITISRCEIGECELAGIGVFGGGIECEDCHFFESSENFLVSILENGTGTFRNCRFEKAGDAGLKVEASPQIVIDRCVFSQCKRGFHGIKVTDCQIEDSQFSGSEFSTIVLKNSHCTLQRVTFRNVIGNGVWAADQSDVTIRDSIFQDGDYPAIFIYQESNALIERTIISRFHWSGIAIRRDSTAVIRDSTIEDSQKAGIIGGGCRLVRVQNTTIRHCDLSLVSALDHGVIEIENCNLEGPSQIPIDCYTGGFIHMADVRVSKVADVIVSVHHGGSFHCERVAFGAGAARNRFLKIETARPVKFDACEIEGGGSFEMNENPGAERAQGGEFAVKPLCVRCQNLADCVFGECGHAQYCRACWAALEPKPETCSLCQLPVENVLSLRTCERDEDPGLCSICVTNAVDGFVHPCGHTMCSGCAALWFEEHTECPFCRGTGSAFKPFVSYG
jgi:uncharacterized protein YjbI with pentapeptide repeats